MFEEGPRYATGGGSEKNMQAGSGKKCVRGVGQGKNMQGPTVQYAQVSLKVCRGVLEKICGGSVPPKICVGGLKNKNMQGGRRKN